MKKHLLILWALLFSILSFAQTTEVYFPLKGSLAWQAPPTPAAGTTLTYYNSTGIVKTAGYDGSWLRVQKGGDYLELSINASALNNLSLSFNGRFSALVGSSTWRVYTNTGTGDAFVPAGTLQLNAWFNTEDNFLDTLPEAANGKSNLKIKIQSDFGLDLFDNLRINDIKLLTGNPKMVVYTNSNVEIPNNSDAADGYNTVFSNLLTLETPGEIKTYRIRNWYGTAGSNLNVTRIQIEPASGTSADDFIVSAISNTTNLPRVTDFRTGFPSYGMISIRFIPQGEGVRRATVKIYSDGTPSPYSFTVIGGGRSCNILNTTYVNSSVDDNVQTLPSDLTPGDFIGGTTAVPFPTGILSAFYPQNNNLYTSGPTSWYTKDVEKTREFGSVDVSELRNVSIEFNVAAFGKDTSNGVINTDNIYLSILNHNNIWQEVMRLSGSNNSRRYSFTGGIPFSKTYSSGMSLQSENNSSGTSYTRFKLSLPLSISSQLTDFKFRIRAKANTNAVWLIDDVRITSDNASYKTWNGSKWLTSANQETTTRPTSREKAVFDGSYNFSGAETADLTVCECEVNAGKNLTIPANKTLTVQGNVINYGNGANFIINEGGNLVQIENGAINTGSITAQKVFTFTKETSDRQQYNYVISPVVGQNLKTIYPGNPATLYYIESTNYFGTSNGSYIPGRSLAVKEPATTAVSSQTVTAEFKGVPFNGVIEFPLTHKQSDPRIYGYNLVGNPYPSSLDIESLYDHNKANIDATFEFWDNRKNARFIQDGSKYSGDNYAKFNAINSTGVAAGGEQAKNDIDASRIPTEFVNVGTGFLVRAKSTANGKMLVFNNTMRSKENGSSFFGKEGSRDRYWLAMITPSEMQFMTAVVYFAAGDNGFGLDDSKASNSSDRIYSVVEDNQIAIQGRATFVNTDKVDLGISAYASGKHTIQILNKEGVFANKQAIYLKDKQTGVITNLSKGSYTFEANQGETTGRFEIIYQPETVLVTDQKVKSTVEVYRDSNQFVIRSPKNIAMVEVYDLSGKMITVLKDNSRQVVLDASFLTKGMYVLRIKMTDGELTTKKIIK